MSEFRTRRIIQTLQRRFRARHGAAWDPLSRLELATRLHFLHSERSHQTLGCCHRAISIFDRPSLAYSAQIRPSVITLTLGGTLDFVMRA